MPQSELGRWIDAQLPPPKFGLGTVDAISALLASQRSVPGISARIVKPTNPGESRHVTVTFSGSGRESFDRLISHPRVRAAYLLEGIDHAERDLLKSGISDKEQRRIRRSIEEMRAEVAEHLALPDTKGLPRTGKEALSALISPAIDDLLNPDTLTT